MELTVDDDDVDHGSVSVRRPTHVDAGVGHATRPDYQHADQHRRLDLLRYDDAARRVRTHLLPVLHHTYMNQYKTYDHGIDGHPLLCYQGPVVVILTYTHRFNRHFSRERAWVCWLLPCIFLFTHLQLEMWANAQCDGRPDKCRWRPVFNAAKFG